MEIAENGSLLDFLKKSRQQMDGGFENAESGLTEQMKTSIAIDVARGMAHLANCRVSFNKKMVIVDHSNIQS